MDLETRMDRIIDWVKTCDTKASIMLTLVGLMTSFVFTSDFVLQGIETIVKSVCNYDIKYFSIHDISISGLLTILFLLLSIYFLFGSIYRLVMVLYSKISEDLSSKEDHSIIFLLFNIVFRYKWHNYDKKDTFQGSLIHFNHISNLDFEGFKDQIKTYDEKGELEDYLSQIFINAKRCKQKFLDYNSAIKWMLCAIPFIIFFFISLFIFCSNNQ